MTDTHTIMLTYHSAKVLYEKETEPLRYIVPGLLVEGGLVFVTAAPKIGKSFFVLLLALCASTKTAFLGIEIPAPVEVVYISYEDGLRRIEQRIKKIGIHGNELFSIITDFPGAGKFIAGLNQVILDKPKTKLIIVDTFAAAMLGTGGEQNGYQNDVDRLLPIHTWAQEHKVTVLCVHHTRKESSQQNTDGCTSDVIDRIIGTHGISGSADCLMILSRNRYDSTGKLEVISRDDEDITKHLVFNAGIWRLAAASEIPADGVLSPEQDKLIQILYEHGPLRPSDIVKYYGGTSTNISNILSKLKDRIICETVSYGVYSLTASYLAANVERFPAKEVEKS